jgi:hypothetical protein
MIAALLAAAPLSAQDPPPLWGHLKPGGYDVGYRRAVLPAGPLHLWFRARHRGGEPLRVGGYVESADAGAYPARLRDAPTAATRNAAAAAGPFPLVLYVGEPGVVGPDNTVLAEYLASHGYVVAAVPWADGGLDAAWAAVGGLSFVRRDTIAMVALGRGWSAAVEFAARQPAVRALLGLNPPPDAPPVAAPGAAPGRSLATLALRADAAHRSADSATPAPGVPVVTFIVPRSTSHTFSDRAAQLHFLGRPDDSAPDHRRLIASVAHAFLDGAVRAWGPSLEDLMGRLSRAGLSVVEGSSTHR